MDNNQKEKEPLAPSVVDEAKPKEVVNLHLDAKKAEVEGDLSKEVQRLRDDVQFETRVLYIGYAVIFVAIGLFIVQAFMQWQNSYDTLLNKVDVLQAKIDSPIPTSSQKTP
jgi:cytoskeletal protein RodZ